MKRELLFLSCAIISIATISCAPRNRTVENPFIEAANTETLDITKVNANNLYKDRLRTWEIEARIRYNNALKNQGESERD